MRRDPLHARIALQVHHLRRLGPQGHLLRGHACEEGESSRQVPVGRLAHEEDILACALMHDSPNMVTAAADGSLKVWNVDSASLRKTLVTRAEHVANHKQALEALAFMHGPQLKHVCVAVGAEQVARWWDIKHCVLQHQMFTGARPFRVRCSAVAGGMPVRH